MATDAGALQSLQQLEQKSLQDALTQYQAAASTSPYAARQVTAAQNALSQFGGLPATPNLINPVDSSTGSVGQSNVIGDIATGLAGSTPIQNLSKLASHGLGDYTAIVLGVVAVGIGLLMFKGTQTVIAGGRRAAEIVAA